MILGQVRKTSEIKWNENICSVSSKAPLDDVPPNPCCACPQGLVGVVGQAGLLLAPGEAAGCCVSRRVRPGSWMIVDEQA